MSLSIKTRTINSKNKHITLMGIRSSSSSESSSLLLFSFMVVLQVQIKGGHVIFTFFQIFILQVR